MVKKIQSATIMCNNRMQIPFIDNMCDSNGKGKKDKNNNFKRYLTCFFSNNPM